MRITHKSKTTVVSVLLGMLVTMGGSPAFAQSQRVEAWEKRINEERQPPEKVMDAVGVEQGMIIGEIGAGRGRYTVHLAWRVGPEGRVYANDISENALSYLRDRCQRNEIDNIEIIKGEELDPLLPDGALDMVFLVWVYHMLENPVPLMKHMRTSLKPGATVVIIAPPDDEIDAETKQLKGELAPDRLTIKERIVYGMGEAGFELIREETFLPLDTIYILQAKK